MKVATALEMRRLDRAAVVEAGIPPVVLMENAGRQVATVAMRSLGKPVGRKVVILAGSGNNGGDGLVAARHLSNAGVDVVVFLLSSPEGLSGEVRVNWEILQRTGQAPVVLPPEGNSPDLRTALLAADLIVDAIVGTGLSGPLRGLPARVVELVNDCHRPVLAVDIPSGVESDSGRVAGGAVRAARTVTLALPKPGLLLYPGAEYAGDVEVADISIPVGLVAAQGIQLNLTTPALVRTILPKRYPDTHKGDYGKVLVLAGSRGYTGAAVLAATGALRVGSGLVTLALPASLQPIAAMLLMEAMTRGLPETAAATLSPAARPDIEELLGRCSAVALGPGLSTQPETTELVRGLIPRLTVPAVIDADGLNALTSDPGILMQAPGPVIITPHAGEMARLLGCELSAVTADRLGTARRAAREWNVTVVLKGAGTVIAEPSGEAYINPTGNPGMATGGTGDVLTGVIAGLLARQVKPLLAAVAGVYLHGLAGDRAAASRGQIGLLAGDLAGELPAAIRAVQGGESPD